MKPIQISEIRFSIDASVTSFDASKAMVAKLPESVSFTDAEEARQEWNRLTSREGIYASSKDPETGAKLMFKYSLAIEGGDDENVEFYTELTSVYTDTPHEL